LISDSVLGVCGERHYRDVGIVTNRARLGHGKRRLQDLVELLHARRGERCAIGLAVIPELAVEPVEVFRLEVSNLPTGNRLAQHPADHGAVLRCGGRLHDERLIL
jgi:hypothetical protein